MGITGFPRRSGNPLIFSTKQLALISVFSALIVIVSRLPGIPILGGPVQGGGSIELSVVLYPVIGLVLGPWTGLVAALLGNLIAWILPTSTVFGLLLIPAGGLAAFVSGCLSHRSAVANWKAAGGILVLFILFWYLTPVGGEAPFYPIFHVSAAGFILLFRERVGRYLHSPERTQQVFGTVVCCYSAILTDHMFGNLAWITSIGIVLPLQAVRDAMRGVGMAWLTLGIYVPEVTIGDIFMFVLPISILERLIYTAVATILSVSIIRVIGWTLISSEVQYAS